MLGTWQATRPASSLTDSSPAERDSSTHNRLGSARARPTTAVRSYSVSRLRLPVSGAGSSIATPKLLHDLRNLASSGWGPEPPVCSRPMQDAPRASDAEPAPEPAPPPGAEPAAEPARASDAPAYLPFGAYAPPSALLPPPPPTWASTYELPSARRVVSAGLQLALSASAELRRGSIYIGLLMLAALAPLLAIVVVALAGIGPSFDRLLGLVFLSPQLLSRFNPNLATLVWTVEAAFILVLILVIAISIDAQAIAICLLAGRATGQPLRVWEAIARARQVFWRLAGASFLLGIPAVIIGFVVGLALNSRNQNPQGAEVASQLLSTLLLAPFAYMSSGIVVGDVGVTEAARRSVRLFRARPRIGLVVVLFPLVASAIQIFALASGVDVVGRVVLAL